jgi:hypothetical protein
LTIYLDRRALNAASAPLEVLRVLSVFGDYCVATATKPPIPTFIYQRNKGRVETAWRSTEA